MRENKGLWRLLYINNRERTQKAVTFNLKWEHEKESATHRVRKKILDSRS